MIYAQHFSQEEFRDWAAQSQYQQAIAPWALGLGPQPWPLKLSEHSHDHWGKIGAEFSPRLVL